MNLFEEHASHYEVLELTADATPQEIRSAYLRLKSAYSKENIAHYTLFSREETESMLHGIENAYLILSNPEKRRAYDQAQGLSKVPDAGVTKFAPNDFASGGYGLNMTTQEPTYEANVGGGYTAPTTSSGISPVTAAAQPDPQPIPAQVTMDLDTLIQQEREWSGAFIKRVREMKRMSLEDLSDYTRISRVYLSAIEQEDYKKLPAVVYVRGFLQQIAKRLKLPVDALSTHYMERLNGARHPK